MIYILTRKIKTSEAMKIIGWVFPDHMTLKCVSWININNFRIDYVRISFRIAVKFNI